MNFGQIHRFAQRGAEVMRKAVPVELAFRGETIIGTPAPGDPSVDLGLGGIRESATLRVRIPGNITPAPRIKEQIEEVATGRKFSITGCIPANPQNSFAADHIVGAQLQ